MKANIGGVKGYLWQVFTEESRICSLLEKIETLKSKQTAGGGGVGLGLGVHKSRDYRRGEDLAVHVLELEEQLARAKTSLLRLEREIKRMTDSLPSPARRAIITWRYICRLKWKDIAARTQMSEMQIMREHNAAIIQMEFTGDAAG